MNGPLSPYLLQPLFSTQCPSSPLLLIILQYNTHCFLQSLSGLTTVDDSHSQPKKSISQLKVKLFITLSFCGLRNNILCTIYEINFYSSNCKKCCCSTYHLPNKYFLGFGVILVIY